MEQENTQTTEPTTSNAPSLGVQDLVTVAKIIQLATSRGAWEASELTPIGQLYDKLMAFLEAAGAVSRGPAQEESPQADTQEK